MQSVALSKVKESSPAYSGTMTKGTKKRLTKAVSLLVQSSKQREIKNPVTNRWQSFKLSFVTLTIPECDTKPDAKFCNRHLLAPLIRVLRRRYGLKSYVWKLELQKNGMIHYHLTSNVFMLHSDLKSEWNNILRRNDMINDYKQRTGKDDPNSTDIKSVRKVKNLEAYLVKYVTKETQNGSKVNSKIWDCSTNLKKAEYFTTVSCSAYQEKIKELVKKKEIREYVGERFIIYDFKSNPVHVLLDEACKRNYYIHLNNIRNYESSQQADQSSDIPIRSPSRYLGADHLPKRSLESERASLAGISELIEERLRKESEKLPFGYNQALFDFDKQDTRGGLYIKLGQQ